MVAVLLTAQALEQRMRDREQREGDRGTLWSSRTKGIEWRTRERKRGIRVAGEYGDHEP